MAYINSMELILVCSQGRKEYVGNDSYFNRDFLNVKSDEDDMVSAGSELNFLIVSGKKDL